MDIRTDGHTPAAGQRRGPLVFGLVLGLGLGLLGLVLWMHSSYRAGADIAIRPPIHEIEVHAPTALDEPVMTSLASTQSKNARETMISESPSALLPGRVDATPDLSERALRFDQQFLGEALEKYSLRPHASNANSLANAYIVAWCDLRGRSEWFDAEDVVKPSLAEKQDEKWIWHADRVGDRVCRFTIEEFPEKWELDRIALAPREILTPLELPPELADQIIARASAVLAELEAR